MKDKEKWERRNNIVIKGVKIKKDEKIRENTKEWVEKFLKERLDIKVKIGSCRISYNSYNSRKGYNSYIRK